jgi:DNA-binding CsgD family transcriptional regulator
MKLHFSSRQNEILELADKGKPSKEIADDLNITTKTVDNIKGIMRKKTNTTNINELLKWAREHGII